MNSCILLIFLIFVDSVHICDILCIVTKLLFAVVNTNVASFIGNGFVVVVVMCIV